IRSRYAKRQAGYLGNESVGFRACIHVPGLINRDNLRGMDLVDGEQVDGFDAQRFCHAGAVFGDLGGRVAGSDAAVEARKDSSGHAATARKECRTDRPQSRKGRRLGQAGLGSADIVHVSNPGNEPSRWGAKAIALNMRPMPVRSGFVRRLKAYSISATRSAGTALLSTFARVSIPSRRRNSPWSIGP